MSSAPMGSRTRSTGRATEAAPRSRGAAALFDLDDTLLTHGRLTRQAYDALWDLHDAGLKLVAVTGRPSGWGEVLARQWPIEGCVTENGAMPSFGTGRGSLDATRATTRSGARAAFGSPGWSSARERWCRRRA